MEGLIKGGAYFLNFTVCSYKQSDFREEINDANRWKIFHQISNSDCMSLSFMSFAFKFFAHRCVSGLAFVQKTDSIVRIKKILVSETR